MTTGKKKNGPAILMIKENSGKWSVPGGVVDKSDKSMMHGGLREFNEEVGTDWRRLRNAAGRIDLIRLNSTPKPPGGHESWLMKVDMDGQDVETLLWPGTNRHLWTAHAKMNQPKMTKETDGCIFVPMRELAKVMATPAAVPTIDGTPLTLRNVHWIQKALPKIAKHVP